MNTPFPRLGTPSDTVATVLLAGLALTSVGCHEPTGSGQLPPPSFLAQPDTLVPGDTFEVVFTLHNPTRDTVVITSAYGCLFFLQVFRGPDPVSMEGASYVCTAAVRTFEVPPGDSLQLVRTLVAAQPNPSAPYGAGAPLPAATYRIRTQMNAALPDAEVLVTVADSVGRT
jgi:hypothetical protein